MVVLFIICEKIYVIFIVNVGVLFVCDKIVCFLIFIVRFFSLFGVIVNFYEEIIWVVCEIFVLISVVGLLIVKYVFGVNI